MALSVSAVVLFAVIVFLLIRKANLHVGHAIVCILLGFYLASSSVAPSITSMMGSVAKMIGSFKF
ncbi:hypothetical protein BIV57_11875 [Mangrovactinospora gilvigrisea]|uniref:DUF2304 domain-containing protein n=1 Tax=Mangrovactinospora gilvigrisea TaxID=1428644 RepID=A0A1J7BUY1_9ACTN|nr:hypothetical protein [Mangrovactinospora gilvigrisea]OIV37281.1 hypothetical protein BIV57_11875 [Mangrovactinospora gilvigrisea]